MEDRGEAPIAIAEGERETDSGVGAWAEQIDEPDTEHEDLPVEENPWPGLFEERMNLLRDVLQADDPRDARERLERFLRTMDSDELRPEEVRPTRLGDPVLSILAQHKAYRICRTKIFCPMDDCMKRIAKVSRLMGHLRRDHGVREEDTQYLVRFFTGTMLPGRLKVNLQSTNGTQVRGEWNVERRHCPGCRPYMRHTIEYRGIYSNTRTCGRTSRHCDGSGASSAR
jgi:hypothetical protein